MLTVYGLEQKEQWDEKVRTFKEYDTYWLNGYVKAFYMHGDGEPLLFYYDNKGTRGINVVMKRDIAFDQYFTGKVPVGQCFDFATPYGYGGWLIEGENTQELFKTYESWCRLNGIVSEFVRFHPMIRNHLTSVDFYEVTQLGKVVHMDISSPETIWNNIISKNRNMIRKAIKNDIKIYNGRYPEIYEVFRSIYNGTMDKDHAESYYYFGKEFYESVLEDLPQTAQVFFAVKDNKVIAASIILSSNGRMNYHLSGSLKEYSSLAPTNLLLYKAALWGSANGYKTLYLGGGIGSGEDNLFKFKKSFFRGELRHFYIGKKIYDKERYHKLLTLRSFTSGNESFFPSYRA